MTELHKWEEIDYLTKRMKVPNGWLYAIELFHEDAKVCFVPEKHKQTYYDKAKAEAIRKTTVASKKTRGAK